MKRTVSILITLVMIFSITTTVAAKTNGNNKNEFIFYDVETGEEVKITKKTKNNEDKLIKWLALASNEYNYVSNDIEIVSVTEKDDKITVNFSKDILDENFEYIEFSYMLMSLRDTIFTDNSINEVNILVEGMSLDSIDNQDLSNGFTRKTIEDSLEIPIIMSIPDAPDPVIVIDAGHDGIYPGAVYNGLEEKTVTLGIALKLKTYLENKGATVYLTRSTDTQLSTSSLGADLGARANVANTNNADLFISIHCNASENNLASGVEKWYSDNHDESTSISLAEDINDSISSRHYLNNRGEKTKTLQVIDDADMTSVLVEVGFMSNTSDFNKMNSSSDQQALAYSIYLGTRKFWYGY